MRTRKLLGLALILCMPVLARSASGQYQITGNPGDWIQKGDYRYRSGYPQEAVSHYNQAYALAAQVADPYGMLNLAARYLILQNEPAAVNSYHNSVLYGQHWMSVDPSRGQIYTYGLNALQALVNYYNNTIRTIPASPSTQEWFRSHTLAANNTVATQMTGTQPPGGPQRQPANPAPRPQSPAAPGEGSCGPINWCDVNRSEYIYRLPNVR
jgi:hypothetical protein